MATVWVRSNRRALAWGTLLPGVALAVGLIGLAWWGAHLPPKPTAILIGGVILAAIGGLGIFALVREMFRPRISYGDGRLFFHLTSGRPEEVPIEFVECFFRGQGSAMVRDRAGNEPEVATVIVRLAERAVDYKHRDVKAALGHWCEGYVTLRGTWCEPIDNDQLLQLNRRLVAAQREMKQQRAATEPSEPVESHS